MSQAKTMSQETFSKPFIVKGRKGAIAAMLLAHGSATHQAHPHLEALSGALNAQRIMTLRFNFEYRKAGRAFPSPMHDSVADFLIAAEYFGKSRINIPLFFGGHSYGGRVATHAAMAVQKASKLPRIKNRLKGMIGFSLPLHPRGKPHLERWSHLQENPLPLLIVSGDRDPMIQKEQASAFLKAHHAATMCWIPGADHAFKQTKSSIEHDGSAYLLAAVAARRWIDLLNLGDSTPPPMHA